MKRRLMVHGGILAAATLGAAALIAVGCGGSQHAREGDHAKAGGGHHGHQGHDAPGEHEGGHVRHDFSDVQRWVKAFEGPQRDAWQRPAEVVRVLGAAAGMAVADIGAGTGYFLPHLRAAVGDSGRVLGLDLQPELVAHMKARAGKAGWANVEARQVAGDDPGLGAGRIDRILIVNTWHHVGAREAYAAKLYAALRAGGAVAIVDFTMDSPHGPAKSHRLLPEKVIAELTAGGLKATLAEESLPHQYVVIGRR